MENQTILNTENIKKPSRKKWIVAGIMVFFILVIGGLWYLYDSKQQNLTSNEDLVQLDPGFIEKTNQDIVAIKKLIDETPDDSSLWRSLGISYYSLGDYEKAKKAFEQAILVNPADHLAYGALGDVSRDMGDMVVAEDNYKKALARGPVFVENYVKLADFYKSQERWAEVEQVYLQGIQNTDRSFVMKQYALFLESKGNFPGALDYWRLALPKEPENAKLIQEEIARLEALIASGQK